MTLPLTHFIRQSASRARRSGGEVTITTQIPTVLIEWDLGECLLQGHEADDFIDKVRDMWAHVGDVTQEECALCEAWAYIETLSD